MLGGKDGGRGDGSGRTVGRQKRERGVERNGALDEERRHGEEGQKAVAVGGEVRGGMGWFLSTVLVIRAS